MINSVRQTVLAIINKQNYGYITPADFNLYSKQAQLDIFEDIFYRYNQWIQLLNQRKSGSDYADIVKNIEEVIDTFSENISLSNVSLNNFQVPSDYYIIDKVYYNNREVERVSNSRIIQLTTSNLTAPTVNYPSYVQTNFGSDNVIRVYPETITSGLACHYIRKPKDPKWTFVTFSEGEPVFDQSAIDYQDFELPKAYEPELVVKVLQYAGVSIRESEVYNYAAGEENLNTQKEG